VWFKAQEGCHVSSLRTDKPARKTGRQGVINARRLDAIWWWGLVECCVWLKAQEGCHMSSLRTDKPARKTGRQGVINARRKVKTDV